MRSDLIAHYRFSLKVQGRRLGLFCPTKNITNYCESVYANAKLNLVHINNNDRLHEAIKRKFRFILSNEA